MRALSHAYAALAERFAARFGLPLSLALVVGLGLAILLLRALRKERRTALGLLPGLVLGAAVVPIMRAAPKLPPWGFIAVLSITLGGWLAAAFIPKSGRKTAITGALANVAFAALVIALRALKETSRGRKLAPELKWTLAHQSSLAAAVTLLAVATVIPAVALALGKSDELKKTFKTGAYLYFGGLFGALFFVAVRVANALPQTHGSKVIVEDEIVRASTLSFGVAYLLLVLGALLPMLLDTLERSGFARFVGARHIRATKSGFLSVISVLSICGVAVSSCALGSVISIMGGFGQDLKRKILANNAHVVVDSPAPTGFSQWEPVLDRVRHAPGVVAATPVITSEVMASVGSNTSGVLLRGIDVNTVGDVIDLRKNIEPGLGSLDWLNEPERVAHLSWKERKGVEDDELSDSDEMTFDLERTPPPPFEPVPTPAPLPSSSANAGNAGTSASANGSTGSSELDAELEKIARTPMPEDRPIYPGIIVGRELAKQLHLRLGSELSLVSRIGELTPAGVIPRERRFRVAGIFFSGMYEYDATHAYVTIEAARDFLEQPENIGAIQVRVVDSERADQLRAGIEAAVGREELRTRDWQTINKNLFGALKLERIATGIVLSLAIIVASFCILCTLLLMVTEKGKEIAILKSLGASDGAIVRIFMVEGMIIGGIGTIFGVATGYAVCFGLSWFGVRIPPDVYYIDRLPIAVNAIDFGLVALAALVICAVSTLYPAVAASTLRPVEGLRYE